MPPRTCNVLFVGNSFTVRNDLPALWAGLASDGTGGIAMTSEVVAAGGASLRQHLNKGTAALLLAEGGWDYVVLQEQSTLPVKNPKRTHENIRDFHGIIEDAGARTILYMTWARLNAAETQATLSATYDDIGAELDCPVVPAGLAWAHALKADPALVLHDADKSHPTLAGSYLAACCFQWTLFGAPVSEPEAATELADDEGDALRHAAEVVCKARGTSLG